MKAGDWMIRLATKDDVERIDEIAVLTIKDMASSKIPQWDMSYPRKPHYEVDVDDGSLIVYEQDGTIVAAMTLKREQDPPYETISGWLTPHGESYVIHRVVVDPEYRRQGIFKAFLQYAIQVTNASGYHSIKIDTHQENYKMRQFLEKHGFTYIGYLEVINREAYELVWEVSK